MRKSLTVAAIVAAIVTGATGCNSGHSHSHGTTVAYDTVEQYGYYDSSHHYHFYSTPRQVRVTDSYYHAHLYQYQPHGSQHAVTVHQSTTTTHHVTTTAGTKVTKVKVKKQTTTTHYSH